jgi:hypothetical protein
VKKVPFGQLYEMSDSSAPGPGEAPEWLQGLFHQQMRAQNDALASMAAQQNQAITLLVNRINTLEEQASTRMDTATPTQSTLTDPLLNTTTTYNGQRTRKHKLPSPGKFDGKDFALYPQFEGMLRAKVEIDGPAIGEEWEQVWYAFGCLEGLAAGRVYPWMSAYNRTQEFTVAKFFQQMAVAFSDPHQQEKALGELRRIKQGTRPFGEFISAFDRLLLEADGWKWDSRIKKSQLKAAVTVKLLQGVVGIPEADSYEDYCSQLRGVSDRMDEIRMRKAVTPYWQNQRSSARSKDEMDWEPASAVVVASARGPRAKWVSEEEMSERRQNGACLRCGARGHFIRDCKMRAQQKSDPQQKNEPHKKKNPVLVAKARVEELNDSDEESGKD